MSVETQHPEYKKMIDEWRLVRACASGEREVKALGTKLLPAPGSIETEAGNIEYDKERYKVYKQRAIYTNVTGRTKKGLLGAAFRKRPTVELSSILEYLEENADGAGQSLIQLSKDVAASVIEVSREFLMVDYPDKPEGMTAEQEAALQLTASIKRYMAEDVINWDTTVIGGKTVLSLVVLKECYNAADQEFLRDPKDQYRVLRLRDDGYTQQVYREGKPITDEVYPTQSNGAKFDFIPGFFIGAQNNDPSVDEPVLADIAHVNVGHYRNSADLEENAFVHGQMTLGISTNLDKEQWDAFNPSGVQVGSRAGHVLGETGAFHSVQAEPNQLTDKLMERKEQQMIALGAKLIEKQNPNETATAAKIDATGENSVLADIVTNVEEGFRKCIEWCGMFMGDESENTFDMNREFFPDSVDPQLLMAAIQLTDRGAMGKTDLRKVTRKAGLIEDERTDEEIDAEANAISPLANPNLNLTGNR